MPVYVGFIVEGEERVFSNPQVFEASNSIDADLKLRRYLHHAVQNRMKRTQPFKITLALVNEPISSETVNPGT